MNYLPLNEFKYAWIFRHQSMPLATTISEKIKPMSAIRANSLWDTFISKQADHPDFFKANDWPNQKKTWLNSAMWEPRWESDEPQLPELITEHLNWDSNTVVYYCINRNLVLETTWEVFQLSWKNFLFVDDGTLLIGKKRSQAVQFFSDGSFKVGAKP
ncbi:DUF2947 family protein [Thalassotalea ganghwensis]